MKREGRPRFSAGKTVKFKFLGTGMISVMPVPLLAAHPRECSPQGRTRYVPSVCACRRFPFGKWRLLTWETENSKHSKCMYTCEIRRGTTGISLQNSKQCTAVPTSHYLPTAKRTWQAMLVFIHPCNLVEEMPQTPEGFQRNRLRSCGAEHQSIFGK